MTKTEALQNVMNALTGLRAQRGEPSEIVLIKLVNNERTMLAMLSTGWSKSSISISESGKRGITKQTVFLILDGTVESSAIWAARFIQYGKRYFQVTDVEAPKEPGGYWLLSVREV